MVDIDTLKEFEKAGALLKGHFILSSGLHSDTYLQCALIMQDAKIGESLCKKLADKVIAKFGKNAFDLVVSPAMGGVVVGYELGRQLGLPAIFCERVDGAFQVRRGFKIEEGARILVVEDVVTTGKSSRETFKCIESHGGKVVAEASLIDRSNGDADLGVPLVALGTVKVATFTEENIPDHLKSIPAIKPGSRFIKN